MPFLTAESSQEHQLITVRFYYPVVGAMIEVQLTPKEAALLVTRLKEAITECGKQSKP